MTGSGKILALAGGVGGGRMAHGLAMTLEPERLVIAVNTADDFNHLGLHVSPDLDSVMYALAEIDNHETGWGIAGETWNFMEALERLGGETWFRLGDRDLATHVERTRRLAAGERLSEITAVLCDRLGIAPAIVPMSDDAVRTVVLAADGRRLAFQDYFVRLAGEPAVAGFEFTGAAEARPALALAAMMEAGEFAAVVICPSNPYVSIDPIRAIPAIGRFLAARGVPAVAVSPIVGGEAIRGPAARMMRDMGAEPSALGIARHYAGLVDGLIIDTVDEKLAGPIEELGMKMLVTGTVMRSAADKARLAEAAVGFALSLSKAGEVKA